MQTGGEAVEKEGGGGEEEESEESEERVKEEPKCKVGKFRLTEDGFVVQIRVSGLRSWASNEKDWIRARHGRFEPGLYEMDEVHDIAKEVAQHLSGLSEFRREALADMCLESALAHHSGQDWLGFGEWEPGESGVRQQWISLADDPEQAIKDAQAWRAGIGEAFDLAIAGKFEEAWERCSTLCQQMGWKEPR